MSDDRKPFGEKKFGGGKKPFGKKPFGKKPFGGGAKFGNKKPWGPRAEGDAPRGPRGPRAEGERGPRREGGFGGDRPFKKRFGGEDRGPGGPRGPRGPRRDFGDRKPSWAPGEGDGPRGPRTDGPRREGGFGDRPFKKRFDDRGPRSPRAEGDRGPRRSFGGDRGPRRDDSRGENRFRGMYAGPQSEEQRENRKFRKYRQDPRPMGDDAPLAPGAEEGEDPARPHLAENELRYHGVNACLALLKARPSDIVRAYVLRDKAEELSGLIEFCAKNHLAYHLVDAGDLERLTDSIHHQGVCVIARAKRFFKEENFFRELGAHRTLVIYLDGVANPHNLGAILRTAAHFGVKWVCVPKEEITRISPALYRTAEGGAEHVNVVRVEDNEKFLDRLQHMGFQLYAFEPGATAIPLFETRLNEKSVFVFGAEVEGLSGIVKTIVETKLTIPGTGDVESLNVSVAAAVAMAEFEKQGRAPRNVRIVKSKG